MGIFDAIFSPQGAGILANVQPPPWLNDRPVLPPWLMTPMTGPMASPGFGQQPNPAQLPRNAQPAMMTPQAPEPRQSMWTPPDGRPGDPSTVPGAPMQAPAQPNGASAMAFAPPMNAPAPPQPMGGGMAGGVGGLFDGLLEMFAGGQGKRAMTTEALTRLGVDPVVAQAMARDKNLMAVAGSSLIGGSGTTEDIKNFERAKREGYKGTFMDYLAAKRAGGGEYGLNPVWGTGPDGQPALIQLGKNGQPLQPKLPEGFQIARDPIKVDGPTGTSILDPQTRQVIQFIPKDVAGAKRMEAEGKGLGEASDSLASIKSKMPGLEKVVAKLDELSGKATYTLGGQAIDFAARQFGAEPREAAVARAQYIAMVDNQVLPLLRDTFGAQFTEREGAALRQTLGDPDKSPKEKQAVLKAFIDQKRRDIEALEKRVSPPAPGAPAAPSAAADPLGIR